MAPRPLERLSEADVIAANFDGDPQLYAASRGLILEQFRADLASGSSALITHDAAGLRRIAHDMKSALALLGYLDLRQCAQDVEALAAASDLPAAGARWAELEARVRTIR